MPLALSLHGLGFGGGVIRLYGVCLRVVWLRRHIWKQIHAHKSGVQVRLAMDANLLQLGSHKPGEGLLVDYGQQLAWFALSWFLHLQSEM